MGKFILDKIAFICHESIMYIHYSNVWKCLDSNDFDIVLSSHLSKNVDENFKFRKKIKEEVGRDIKVYDISDVQEKGLYYRYVVSNHAMEKIQSESLNPVYVFINMFEVVKNYIKCVYNYFISESCGSRKKYSTNLYPGPLRYIPEVVGDKQIRFMYGPDLSDGWSLGKWNNIYDLFLCHGEVDSEKIKKNFNKMTRIMGYPRYDNYFKDECLSEKVRKEFCLSPDELVIYWMPTCDAFNDNVCSIPFYAEFLSHIGKYKIIVRPHPITFRRHPEFIALLEKNGFLIDDYSMRDTSEIFKVSLAVLCDHGGSAFGAFYLQKKLIFLETPGQNDAIIFKNSTNENLSSYFPVLNAKTVKSLVEIIEDEELWDDIYKKSAVVYRKTFGASPGESAKTAASILKDIRSIL